LVIITSVSLYPHRTTNIDQYSPKTYIAIQILTMADTRRNTNTDQYSPRPTSHYDQYAPRPT